MKPCLFPMLLLAIIISQCAGEQSSLDYAKTRSRLLTLSLLHGAEDDRLPSHPLTEVVPEKQDPRQLNKFVSEMLRRLKENPNSL